jgi:hypothetical protein
MSTAVPPIIVFRESCEAHALAVRNGAEDLREAGDALQNLAQAVGIEELGGQDAVQRTIAEALTSEAAQPSNGFDEHAFNKICDDARAEHDRAKQQAEQQEQSERDENRNELPPEAEDAIALAFADRHAHELRYVTAWGRWLSFDGSRWADDTTLHTFDRMRAICREIAFVGDKPARAVASAKTVVAVERLARADRRFAATAEHWDDSGWKLNEGEDDNGHL